MIGRRSPRPVRQRGRSIFALSVVVGAWVVGLLVNAWISPYTGILASVSFLAIGFVIECVIFRRRGEVHGFPVEAQQRLGHGDEGKQTPPFT